MCAVPLLLSVWNRRSNLGVGLGVILVLVHSTAAGRFSRAGVTRPYFTPCDACPIVMPANIRTLDSTAFRA